MVNAAGFKEFTGAFNARDPVVELLLRDPDVWMLDGCEQLGLSACWEIRTCVVEGLCPITKLLKCPRGVVAV